MAHNHCLDGREEPDAHTERCLRIHSRQDASVEHRYISIDCMQDKTLHRAGSRCSYTCLRWRKRERYNATIREWKHKRAEQAERLFQMSTGQAAYACHSVWLRARAGARPRAWPAASKQETILAPAKDKKGTGTSTHDAEVKCGVGGGSPLLQGEELHAESWRAAV